MVSQPPIFNETERLSALRSLGISDGARPTDAQTLVDCARRLFDVPICLISLVDETRVWFRSVAGVDLTGADRAGAFCNHTILGDSVFVVEDAIADSRFRDSCLVTGDSKIRFYAGAPLKVASGHVVGSFCIADREPRALSADLQAMLRDMALIAVSILECHKEATEGWRLAGEAEAQRQRAEARSEALKLRERHFQQTESIAKVGGWEFDLATGRSAWSDELYRIHGYPIGTEMTVAMRKAIYAVSDQPRVAELFESLRTHSLGYEEEFEIITPAGERKLTRICGKAIIVDGVRRIFGTTQDITHRTAAERDLKLRGRHFQQTEHIAKVGGWEFDPATGKSVWSDELYRIHGYPIGTEMTVAMGIAIYAVSDQPRVAKLVERLMTHGLGYNEEFEIVTPAGERKWTRVCAEAEIVDGVVQRLFGSTQDITQQRSAEIELKRRERQFLRTEQLAQTGGWQLDKTTKTMQWSDELYRIHEIPCGTPITFNMSLAIYPVNEQRRLRPLLERLVTDGVGFEEEFEFVTPSGRTKWNRTIAEAEMVDGVPTRIFGIQQDVTQLRDAERTLKSRERRFQQTERIARVGGWEVDPATNTSVWSDELYRIHGHPIGTEITFDTAPSLFAERDRPRFKKLFERMKREGVALDEEFEIVTPAGERKWTRVCAEVEQVNGVSKRFFGTTQDITERRAAERELWHGANFDSLTGLANRARFAERIGVLFGCGRIALRSPDRGIGLLMIDVDRLKETNDSLGHAAGDALLQAVAKRLSEVVGNEGNVARLGGDEFVVTLDGFVSTAQLAEVAQAIIAAMQLKVQHNGQTLSPQVSIGGAVALEGDTAELLRQKADVALYECKKVKRGRYIEFREDLRSGILHRIGILRRVDEALTEGNILPYYQPIVRLDTREVVSFEALARMRMPSGQIVSAGAFQEIMDEPRIAHRLTGQMLAQVAADVRCWLDAGLTFQRVGVNVTSADFQTGDLRTRLNEAFGRHGVPLTHAIVEVTEMVFMNGNEAAVVRELENLRKDGVLVALDDFGTGYASLTHLRTLPVDVLKIDRSFVNGMLVEKTSGPIIEALSGLALKLGLRIVAEGIETVAHSEYLRSSAATSAKASCSRVLTRQKRPPTFFAV